MEKFFGNMHIVHRLNIGGNGRIEIFFPCLLHYNDILTRRGFTITGSPGRRSGYGYLISFTLDKWESDRTVGEYPAVFLITCKGKSLQVGLKEEGGWLSVLSGTSVKSM